MRARTRIGTTIRSLLELAGLAPGQRRRGSTLVLVLGTLALISVFASVYIAIGQGDRRTVTALEIRREVGSYGEDIGLYITDIIGRDMFDAYPRFEVGSESEVTRAFAGGGPVIREYFLLEQQFIREATDAPYTDWTVRSQPMNFDAGSPTLTVGTNFDVLAATSQITQDEDRARFFRFRPSGTHLPENENVDSMVWPLLKNAQNAAAPGSNNLAAMISAARPDRRVASDPWLASVSPSYLGGPLLSTAFGGLAEDRPFSGAEDRTRFNLEVTQDEYFWLDHRDWKHISNVAPDGMFVNLFNLRPQANENATSPSGIGGFDAKPGIGVQDGRTRMSEGLSLYTVEQISMANETNPQISNTFRVRAMSVRDEGFWLPGLRNPAPWDENLDGAPELVPAIWDSNQRFSLIPLNQPFEVYDRDGADPLTWADPDYPAYQWADTDGDGFADARWFEMVDTSATTGPDDDELSVVSLLNTPGFRVFAAARVVDLSAMVNVNTATDGLVPPTAEIPLGSSPAEISLRRALTMQDQARSYAGGWRFLGNNVFQIDEASGQPSPWDLSLYDARREGRTAEVDENVDAYADYSRFRNNVSSTLNPIEITLERTGLLVGRLAQSASRRAIESGATFGYEAQGSALATVGPVTEESPYNTDNNLRNIALRRYFAFDRIGSQDPTDPSAASSDLTGALYGLEDLRELLTYHGLNDDATVSTLERDMFGRLSDASEDPTNTAQKFSPLMSTRITQIDRFRHDSVQLGTNGDQLGVDGRIDRDGLAMLTLSPRRRITSVSGAIDILGERVRNIDTTRPDAVNFELDAIRQANKPLPPRVAAKDSLSEGDIGATALDLIRLAYNPRDTRRVFEPDGLAPSGVNPITVTNLAWIFGEFMGPMARDARFTTAWDSSIADNPLDTLFYGHQGPELATILAAMQTVNLIDAYDRATDFILPGMGVDPEPYLLAYEANGPDLEPTPFHLLLTDNNDSASVVTDFEELATAGGAFPWQEFRVSLSQASQLHGFLTLAGDRTTRVELEAPSSADLEVNATGITVYGNEPYPVITEAAAISVLISKRPASGFIPFPQTRAYFPGAAEFGPEWATVSGTSDPIQNAGNGLVIMLNAYQITNPFDVEIVLGSRDRVLDNSDNYDEYGDSQDDESVGNALAPDEYYYYIEHEGRYYKLGHFDGSANVHDTVLGPGESRVFYALAEDPVTTETRWASSFNFSVGADTANYRGSTALEQWVISQLSVEPEGGSLSNDNGLVPLRLASFNPTDGVNSPIPVFENIQAPASGGGTEMSQPVRLWRWTDPDDDESTADVAHHQLVDRLRVDAPQNAGIMGATAPEATLLAAPLDPLESFTDGFVRGIDPADIPTWEDLRTIVLYSSVRRREHPGALNPGALPAWMLEGEATSTITTTPVIGSVPGSIPSDLDQGDWNLEGQVRYAFPSFDAFYSSLRGTAGALRRPVVATIASHPNDKGSVESIPLVDTATGSFELSALFPAYPLATTTNGHFYHPDRATAMNAMDGGFESLRPVLYPADRGRLIDEIQHPDLPITTTITKVRPTDLLRVPAVSAIQVPNPALPTDFSAANEYDRWMTYGEAAAYALDMGATPQGFDGIQHVMSRLVRSERHPLTGVEVERFVLRDLTLRTDDFVRYYNADAFDETMEHPTYDPLQGDVVVGAGVPAMVEFLSRFRTNGPLDAEEALDTKVAGRLNLNTADAMTLRAVPLLSPSREKLHNSLLTTSHRREFFSGVETAAVDNTYIASSLGSRGLDLDDLGLLDPTDPRLLDPSSPLDPSTATRQPNVADIAAHAVAYRDRHVAEYRSGSFDYEPSFERPMFSFIAANPANGGQYAVTAPVGGNIFNSPELLEFSRINRENMLLDEGRALVTGIEALRPEPWLTSPAELAASGVNPYRGADLNGDLNPFDNGTPQYGDIQRLRAAMHNSPNAYALDGLPLGASLPVTGDTTIAVDDLFYGNTSTTTDVPLGVSLDGVIDDVGERHAVLDALMGTTTTRSDTYAVWMVVHAYQESDVANLRETDPLVPSIAKRYVMVVDRSNVRDRGDAPEVLLFREVPF